MHLPNDFTREQLPCPLNDFSSAWGLVLGSGLGSFVDGLTDTTIVHFVAIPGLPVSKVPGHSGRLVCGKLGGVPVVVLQGRVHLYEGHEPRAVTAGVRLMAAMGVKQVVLTNAAGTLNSAFPPGQWMMLSDHLNLTGKSPLTGGPHFLDLTEAYSSRLRSQFRAAASLIGIPLHEGVYAGLPGPQYETPAEVRMLAHLGADAVGMSTVLETIQARALGLEVAAFSCLTNWAAGITGEKLDHNEVMDTGRHAAEALIAILQSALTSSNPSAAQ